MRARQNFSLDGGGAGCPEVWLQLPFSLMGHFSSWVLTGSLSTLYPSASNIFSGSCEQSAGLEGSSRIFTSLTLDPSGSITSLMLDPSGLHGAGPSTNGRWMDEQEIGLQLQLGREGHCLLWALGGFWLTAGATVRAGHRGGQMAPPESPRAACGL